MTRLDPNYFEARLPILIQFHLCIQTHGSVPLWGYVETDPVLCEPPIDYFYEYLINDTK